MRKNKKIFAAIGASLIVALASCSSDGILSSSNSNNETTSTIEDTTKSTIEETTTSTIDETTTETTTSENPTTTETTIVHQHDLIHVDYLAPKCDALGHDEYDYCESCGKYFDNDSNEVTLEELTIPQLHHFYASTTYTWSSDNTTCTATRVCENCNVSEMETVFTTAGIKTPASCKNKGVKLYTAEFSNLAFETQTKEVDIPLLDHKEGTPVKENIVEATYDSTGSYDLVTYCDVCGIELSKETITTPKLNTISEYHDVTFSVSYGDMLFTKGTNSDYLSLYKYYGNKESLIIPDAVSYEGVLFPVERIESIGTPKKLKNIVVPSSIKRIEEYAFKNVNTLESITLNEGLEYIGVWAFEKTSLKSIVLPKTVKKIDSLAFKDVKTLESVTLNEGLEFLGQSAFKNTGIKKIVIPKSVTTIQDAVFSGCISLEEVVFEDGITTISSQMFFHCSNLDKITFPEGLKTIKTLAFAGCDSLKEIELPEGIDSFSDAFCNCNNLKKVVLPKGLTKISSSAFHSCISLEEVEIQEGLEVIGEDAFKNCKSLNKINLPLSLKTIQSDAFYGCTSLDTIDLPSSLETIASYAFSNTNLVVFIPSTVKNIEYNAFNNVRLIYTNALERSKDWSYSFTNLESVAYGVEKDGLVFVDDMAFVIDSENETATFLNCLNEYKSLTIPSKVTFNENEYAVTKILRMYFSDNDTIEEVILPDTVVSFEDYTFYRCDALKTLVLPASVRDLGNGFLAASTSIKSISIPEGVTIIQERCFNSCASLEKVILPSTLEEIDKDAFSYCYKLVEIYNLSNVMLNSSYELMKYCIVYNTSLSVESQIKYDSNGFLYVANDDVCHLVDYIGREEKIVLPNSISINSKVFNEYSIHRHAFAKNQYIKSITIPGSVKEIGDYAFARCESLSEVNIEDGVQVLGEGVFQDCTSIKRIVLPNSIIEMKDGAFYNCTSLESVTLSDNIPVISECCFLSCDSLKTIHLPSALTEIGENAFKDCYNLSNVVLPNQLTTIGELAFLNCGKITSIEIPSSVRTIGRGAFAYVSSLEELIISEGVEEIGIQAFRGCKKLTSVTIPSTVTSIGESIFLNCYRLAEIYNLGKKDDTLLSENVKIIHTSKDEASIVVIDEEGFIFGYDGEKGYLFGYKGNTKGVITLTLPEYFIYNGQKITSYSIVSYAFSGSSVGLDLLNAHIPYQAPVLSLIIPSCVTDIEVDAFFKTELVEIYNLSSCEITFSSSTHPIIITHTSLEEKSNIFVDDDGYVFRINENTINAPVQLRDYIGVEHDLVLPNKVIYNGKVYSEYVISSAAFSKKDDITSIRVSSSVKELGRDNIAFCENLEYIVVSKNTELWDRFMYCANSTPKLYYYGTYDELKLNYIDINSLNAYYFTSNKENESRTGKWWYYDTDSFTIIEKIVE